MEISKKATATWEDLNKKKSKFLLLINPPAHQVALYSEEPKKILDKSGKFSTILKTKKEITVVFSL
jgi:hypothetical protein